VAVSGEWRAGMREWMCEGLCEGMRAGLCEGMRAGLHERRIVDICN
jgi:hypothetical protein